MKSVVLLIDDEVQIAELYSNALQQLLKLDVVLLSNPDEVFDFIEKHQPTVAAIILDIMMLPGTKYQEENTDEGLRTGVFMYEDLRDLFPQAPVIVLTNVSNDLAHSQFHEGPFLRVVQKLDFSPFMLADVVKTMINESSHRSSRVNLRASTAQGLVT